MRLACIQSSLAPGAWQENVEKGCAQAEEVIERQHPDLVLFPEGFPSYLVESGVPKGEPLDGPTTQRMKSLAATGSCLVLFGMLRVDSDGLHNSAILVDGSRVLGMYDKSHLYYAPSTPELNEQRIFAQGKTLGLFDTHLGKIGVMICHDGVYLELPRALALGGADVICWLMNNGNMVSWAQHYARACLLPVAIANPVGPQIRFSDQVAHGMCGASVIIDGDGRTLAEAPEQLVTELVADVDLSKWREVRAKGERMQAIYRVRRPDLYGSLASEYIQAKPIQR